MAENPEPENKVINKSIYKTSQGPISLIMEEVKNLSGMLNGQVKERATEKEVIDMQETPNRDLALEPSLKKKKTSEYSTVLVLCYRKTKKIHSNQLENDQSRENSINPVQEEVDEGLDSAEGSSQEDEDLDSSAESSKQDEDLDLPEGCSQEDEDLGLSEGSSQEDKDLDSAGGSSQEDEDPDASEGSSEEGEED
ncbi:sperm protein associated with the nucleus on the X chromosome N2-like [Pongo abelii]|uniref:sperm protein associated with the nucleus on the X chromosome N2-like n=1 Tax=Pongo abelii TaxID=9601 RepID=UPI0023E7AE47|nr:sperm protein associated with the nucleus on the X chromosome N2-like [Pongo abelii]